MPKISDLPSGAPAAGSDIVPVVRGGQTLQVPLSSLTNVIPAGPAGPTGAAGPAGPAGAQGEQGPAGASGTGASTASGVLQFFSPEAALYPTSNYAQFKSVNGTNFPVNSLAFDASTDESVYFRGIANNFGSVGAEVRLRWYADTATTGTCIWGVKIGAITPNTDSQDIETKALTTEQTVTTTHLGTTGQRLQESVLTLANLDSLADLDDLTLQITRKASSDTMTGDALLVGVIVRNTSNAVPPVAPDTSASELPAFNTAAANKIVNPALAPNGTTIFATIQAAVDTANPGDVIAVAPGTYYETVLVNRSGTVGSPIYIQAQDPNNKPVIDGQMLRPNAPMSNGATNRLVAISASYIVWDSIDVVNSAQFGMTLGPSAFNNGFYLQSYEIATELSTVKVLRTRIEKCTGYGIVTLNTNGAYIGGCTLREIGRLSDEVWNSTTQNPSVQRAGIFAMGKNVSIIESVIAQSMGPGISAGGDQNYGAGAFIQAETLVIRKCRVFDTWGGPLRIVAVNGATIERNVFYSTGDARFWAGRSGSPQYPLASVEFKSEGGAPGAAAWSTGYIGAVNVTFRNNVVWGGQKLLSFVQATGQLYSGILIQHNTLFGSQAGAYTAGAGAIANSMTNLTNLTFQNNIVYDAAGRIVASDPGWTAPIGSTTKGYNLWSHTAPVSLQGTGDVTNSSVGLTNVTYVPSGAWPSISSFDTESFKLTGASVALAAGVTSTVTNDFFGTARPNPPDIGAHERT